MSEAYVSYFLRSAEARERRGRPFVPRSASASQAEQIAALLCSDAERREVLLEHLHGARTGMPDPLAGEDWSTDEAVASLLAELDQLRTTALGSLDPVAAALAYEELWERGRLAVSRIDPQRQCFARVRILLMLHEVACVRDRPDLALRWAREAWLVLRSARVPHRQREERAYLQVNIARAEIVALNNLGLAKESYALSQGAQERLPGIQSEPGYWLPQLYSDRLAALRGMRRFPVSEAENLRDFAGELTDDATTQLLLDERLAGALISHGSALSLRKARPLVERGLHAAYDQQRELGPLRRALLLRTAAWYEWKAVGSTPLWEAVLRHLLHLVTSAGLTHQQRKLRRLYGDQQIDRIERDADLSRSR